MSRKLAIIAFLMVVGCAAHGQVFSNIQNTSTNWGLCFKPSCDPGGSGTPTGFTQTFGASSVISISGPAFSDGLAFYQVNGSSNAIYFNSDFSVTVSSANAQAYEFDQYKFTGGTAYMFGTQCVIGAKWQVWSEGGHTWVDTPLSCSLTAGTPHHIKEAVHISGTLMSYDTLTIDGTTTILNVTEPSGPRAVPDAIGIQFQPDINSTGTALTMTLQNVNFSAQAASAAWAGIIDPSRANLDWSTAGIPEGIPNRTTNCATIAAYNGTAATINSAIASCPANQVVLLGAGTFNLTTGIDFANHSNVTLRGAGANQTFLVMTGHAGCQGTPTSSICVEDGSGNWPGGPQHTANWTAGYAKGTNVITLSSTANIVANQTVLILDQNNDTSDSGFIYVCETVGTCSQETPAGGERSGKAQEQLVLVTAVNGNNVTISPGLYMPNWSSTKSPGAWWSTQPVTMDGVENLSVDNNNNGGNSGVAFVNAYKCWMKGVRSMNAARNQVWIYASSRIVVRDSYLYNSKNHASQSYGIEPFMGSDWLAENNIFQLVTTPMQLNGAGSGGVIGYNFTIANEYTNTTGWLIAGLSWHAAGVDDILMEGNEVNAMVADNIHGTHSFTTIFRNQSIGNGTTVDCNGVACNSQTNAGQIYFGSRIFNFVGNVLGQQGYHTNYEDACPSGTNSQHSIWVLGYFGNGGSGNCDANVKSTMMRWANFDYVHNSAQFNNAEVPAGSTQFSNAIPATHTLPPSFYLPAKPSWWGTMPYPAVGPDVTGGTVDPSGMVYSNPARNCYFNVMGGSTTGTGGPFTFNPAACYAGAPVTPTVSLSPTSINFGNQTINTPSAPSTVTLTNTGSLSVSITSIALQTGTQYSVSSNTCSSTLGIGSSCTVGLTFTPTSTGAKTDSLVFTDSATGSPQSVALSGTGVVAAVPVVSLSSGSSGCGSSTVGAQVNCSTVTLTNTGTGPLSISSMTASSQFGVGSNCGSTLNAGSSCVITPTFTPAGTGAITGTVTITDNASGSPHHISLSGTGTAAPAPVVSLSSSSSACGSVNVGFTGSCPTVTLTNTGSATLNIASITPSGAAFGVTTTCGSTLFNGSSCTITPSFTPSGSGATSGSVSIVDNASGSPHVISLTGTGVTPSGSSNINVQGNIVVKGNVVLK